MAYSPSPNTVTSGNLSQHKSVFLSAVALDRLTTKFLFKSVCQDDMIPRRNGKSVEWFRYDNPGANTTPSTEGAVGTSITFTSHSVGATISQYSDYVTYSTMLKNTIIDDVEKNFSDLLGYRAGLTLDNLTRAVIDGEFAGTTYTLFGAYATFADLRAQKHKLTAKNVKPFEKNQFKIIAHPYVTYDIVNDPQANGLPDLLKFNTQVENGVLFKAEDRGIFFSAGNYQLWESTNVKITLGSPNLYRMYFFGAGGMGCSSLQGFEPSYVTDPAKESFKINSFRGGPDKTSAADPTGEIAGGMSYWFTYVAVPLDGPAGIGGTYRFLLTDCPSSIG